MSYPYCDEGKNYYMSHDSIEKLIKENEKYLNFIKYNSQRPDKKNRKLFDCCAKSSQNSGKEVTPKPTENNDTQEEAITDLTENESNYRLRSSSGFNPEIYSDQPDLENIEKDKEKERVGNTVCSTLRVILCKKMYQCCIVH